MKNLRKVIFGLLFIAFAAHIIFRIASYSKEYLTPFDHEYWKARYNQSQWVVPNSKNSIGDDGLYAHAGWEYIHGANPTLLNAEIPPLAKYVIGLGEVIFQNQNIIILIVGILTLFILYKINTAVFKDRLLAFIPVALFSFDPIFYSQLRAPYLDGIYLLFLSLTILFVLKKKYFLSAFFLGCFASIKFPVGATFLLVPIVAWVMIFDKKNLKTFLFSLLLCPIVFLFSYIMFFVKGGSIIGFLGVQKWIIHFYSSGAKAGVGIVFPIILFGKWFTWFSGVQKVSEWNVFWAISFIGSFFASFPLTQNIYRLLKQRINMHKKIENENITLIFLWVVSYTLFLSFTPVFPRYLLLLLPFMYNLTVWFSKKYVFPHFS